jgi:ATP-dependent Lon protease
MRKITKDVVLKRIKSNGVKAKKVKPLETDSDIVEKYLGVPKFKEKKATKENKTGSATGLAWTSMGGDILNIEVSVMPGKEKLTLTGQLGDVMKESAFAALSLLITHSVLSPKTFSTIKRYIYISQGANPKDAVCWNYTCLLSHNGTDRQMLR